MCVFVCLCWVDAMCVLWPQRPEEVVRSGVKGGCEFPDVHSGNYCSSLEEQKLTLTTQASSPLQESFIKKGKCLLLVEACHRAAVKELILGYVSGLFETWFFLFFFFFCPRDLGWGRPVSLSPSTHTCPSGLDKLCSLSPSVRKSLFAGLWL